MKCNNNSSFRFRYEHSSERDESCEYLFKASLANLIMKAVDSLLSGHDSSSHVNSSGGLGSLVTCPLRVQTRLRHHVYLSHIIHTLRINKSIYQHHWIAFYLIRIIVKFRNSTYYRHCTEFDPILIICKFDKFKHLSLRFVTHAFLISLVGYCLALLADGLQKTTDKLQLCFTELD